MMPTRPRRGNGRSGRPPDRATIAAMADDPLSAAFKGARALARAGLRVERPDRLPRAMLALAAAGPTLAGAIGAEAARYPLAAALIDDHGATTYLRLWRGSSEVARELHHRGLGEQSI